MVRIQDTDRSGGHAITPNAARLPYHHGPGATLSASDEKAALGYAYHHHATHLTGRRPSHGADAISSLKSLASSRAASWAVWLASVLVTSLLINSLSATALPAWLARDGLSTVTSQGHAVYQASERSTIPAAPREIEQRDACAQGGNGNAGYGMPLRIGAVFIIMGVSGLACGFPSLARRFPGLNMPSVFFFAVRHFGTGVLIATAFCHLLPTAFSLLNDPCLPKFWNEDYPAMPGAIALAGILFITVVEMLLHPAHTSKPSSSSKTIAPKFKFKGNRIGRSRSIARSLTAMDRQPTNKSVMDGEQGKDADQGVMSNDEGQNSDGIAVAANLQDDENAEMANAADNSPNDSAAWGAADGSLTADQKLKKDVMNCLLLEMGILFHSVFIGMALSVSIGGSEFVILLIAIAFHQTFEGLALGARIADIDWPKGSLKPLFMVIAYGCTTPLGQAIGLAAHSAYDPDSKVGLILVGVMNAISSGLLVFASLVELLSEDLLTDESWRVLRGRKRVAAFMLIVAGAFGMSLVGAWA